MQGRIYKMPKEKYIGCVHGPIDLFVCYVLRFCHGSLLVPGAGETANKTEFTSQRKKTARRKQIGSLQRRIMSTLQKKKIIGRDCPGQGPPGWSQKVTLELRPKDEKPGTGTVFRQREQCHSVQKDKACRVGDTERAVWPDSSEAGTC